MQLLRLLIIVLTSLFFWGAWYVLPAILEAKEISWLSGGCPLLWGLEFYFLQRLSQISSCKILSAKENERLRLRMNGIRKRVWWAGGVILSCSILIWIMAAANLPAEESDERHLSRNPYRFTCRPPSP
jgi:hypothetical protein